MASTRLRGSRFRKHPVSLSIVRSRYSVRGQSWVVEGDVEAEKEKEGKNNELPFSCYARYFYPPVTTSCRKTKRQRGKEWRRKRSKLQRTKNNEANSVCSSREVHSRILWERKENRVNYHNFTKATRAHMYRRILRQTYTYTHIHLFNFAPFAHQLV